MCVSCARHASATGLSRPDTTRVSVSRTRARSGGAAGRVDGAAPVFVLVLVVAVGAGLVGGIGRVDVVSRDDPLLHVARTSAPATTHERRTQCSVRAQRLRARAATSKSRS